MVQNRCNRLVTQVAKCRTGGKICIAIVCNNYHQGSAILRDLAITEPTIRNWDSRYNKRLLRIQIHLSRVTRPIYVLCKIILVDNISLCRFGTSFIIEPRCEKTGLRGFRPGPIQTGLCSQRRWLEA